MRKSNIVVNLSLKAGRCGVRVSCKNRKLSKLPTGVTRADVEKIMETAEQDIAELDQIPLM